MKFFFPLSSVYVKRMYGEIVEQLLEQLVKRMYGWLIYFILSRIALDLFLLLSSLHFITFHVYFRVLGGFDCKIEMITSVKES
jgi:hypothetical protein